MPVISWLGEMIIHEVPFYGRDARLARSTALNGAGACELVNRGFSGIRELDGAKATLFNHRTITDDLPLPPSTENQIPERRGLRRRRVLQRFDVGGVRFANGLRVGRHVTRSPIPHAVVAEELVPDIVVVDGVPRELQSSR